MKTLQEIVLVLHMVPQEILSISRELVMTNIEKIANYGKLLYGLEMEFPMCGKTRKVP